MNDRSKDVGVIGAVSRRIGTFTGKTAAAGKYIVTLGGSGSTSKLPKRPVDTAEPVVASEQAAPTPAHHQPLPEQELEVTSLSTAIGAITSDLTTARRELAETRGEAKNTQSDLGSQIQTLQKEKNSLIVKLEEAMHDAEVTNAQEIAARARFAELKAVLAAASNESKQISAQKDTEIAAAKSEIGVVRQELAESRSEAKNAREQFETKIASLQKEKESLACELREAQQISQQAKDREAALKARLGAMESNIAAARNELMKVPSAIEPATPKPASKTKSIPKKQVAVASVPPVEPKPIAAPAKVKQAIAPAPKEPAKTQKQPSAPAISEEPADVTPEELSQAVFSGAAEKVIFTRATIDIAGRSDAARRDAVKALSRISHKLSVKAIVAQLGREASPQVRQECVKALTELGMAEGHSAVTRALTDQDASVRLAAVWGVYLLDGVQSAPALEGMLPDPDEGIRRRAVACIGWLGKEELAPSLLPLLDDNSPSVRQAAIEAMGSLNSPKVVSALIKLINDSNTPVGQAALRSIQTITGKKMSKSLPKDEKPRRRLMARWEEWWKEQQDAE